MIKNIIFDIGRVLIFYEPVDYLRGLGYDEDKVKALNEAIFLNPFWLEFDRGTYNYAEGIEYLSEKYPSLADDIKKVLHKDWMNILTPKIETVEFLKNLKKEGYKIYFLSNFSIEGFEFIYEKYDFFKLCDGKVISAYIKKIKPDKEIYEHLLNEYSLKADESIFIDDSFDNIEAAKNLGFKTILFTDIEDCKKQFETAIK